MDMTHISERSDGAARRMAASHRSQLAIRERAVIFERAIRSVAGLAHDRLRQTVASGHTWKTSFNAADGITSRRGNRNARGPSGDLIKFLRR